MLFDGIPGNTHLGGNFLIGHCLLATFIEYLPGPRRDRIKGLLYELTIVFIQDLIVKAQLLELFDDSCTCMNRPGDRPQNIQRMISGDREQETGKVFYVGELMPDLPYLQEYILYDILCQLWDLYKLEDIGL